MIKSFISLKPSSSPHYLKLDFLNKQIKAINILYQAMDVLFNILDFVQLNDIFILYSVSKFNKKSGNQVTRKIVSYLIKSQRSYTFEEQKKFIRHLTMKCPSFSLKQYMNQNIIWKQPISLDIERTTLTQLMSQTELQKLSPHQTIGTTKNQLFKPQMKKQIANTSRIKPSFLSIKFNFLMFNNDEQYSKKVQLDKKLQQNNNLKAYLKTVLNAISNRNKQLGYVQGLNFWIKNMFQTKLSEKEAFSYACFLLQKIKVQSLFKNQMIKISELCFVFDIYLYNNLPSIYFLLKRCQVTPSVYASNWFITLFSQQLSKRIINKIWHLFILKGWKILIMFGISVLFSFQNEIKKIPHDQMFFFMRKILQKVDKQKQKNIWAIMPSIKVSNKMIEYLSNQMKNLYNDTEIQLWRIQQQNFQVQTQNRLNCRRFSLTGRVNDSNMMLNSGRKRSLKFNHLLQQQYQSNGCCSNYSRMKIRTESTQDNYSILSLCGSVNLD